MTYATERKRERAREDDRGDELISDFSMIAVKMLNFLFYNLYFKDENGNINDLVCKE